MKNFILCLIFFLTACTPNNSLNNLNDLNFSNKMSFEEFKVKLDIYSEKSDYPDIDD